LLSLSLSLSDCPSQPRPPRGRRPQAQGRLCQRVRARAATLPLSHPHTPGPAAREAGGPEVVARPELVQGAGQGVVAQAGRRRAGAGEAGGAVEKNERVG
jgi:hypothetical protein